MKAIINNSTCMIVSRERLTRGTVGKTMEAEFSADWEGLAITATFEAGDEKRDKVYTGEPIVIPHEVLTTAGVSVMLGFQGALPDGTIVKRTEKEWLNNVSETLDPAGVPSSEPTPDVVAQIQQAAANAEALARSVREDADLGKFQGTAGQKGDKGNTGPAGRDGKSAYAYAVEGGYTGTEAEFAAKLAAEIPVVDATLTQSGQAADAKAVGDKINSLSEEIVTTSESKVAAHNAGTDTHSDIRLLIQGLTDRLNALADSDDTTLDQLSEVVAYIKSNRSLIEAITTSKVSVADIVDNLTTNVSNKPLSAAQGVVIKTLIDALRNDKLDAAELTNAVNTALAQAKASGEFDGADGKSAYQYAVEGGYTGTKEKFAAKLAEENPDLTDTEIITAPGYTNQISISTDTDGSIYNGVGYKSGYYLGSTGSETAGGNTLITGFIPVVKGDVIRIKDAKIDDTLMIALYPASKSPSSNIGKTIANIKSNAIYGSITVSGDEIVWDTSTIGYHFWSDIAYMRATIWSADAIITVNEEITETVTEKKVLKPDIKVKQGNLDFSIMSPMLSGKNVVFFGDSIFGLTRDSTSVAAYTSQFTGATVFNVGFGGCRMAVHPTSGYAAFSMWALADAVSSGSFTAQEEQAASGEDYFSKQLALLKSIDFSDVDMIVIHYGTNDFTGNVNIDNESDDDDTATLCGALRYSLRKIQTAYPEIRIFVSLPIYRKWNDTGAETYTNSSGNKLWDFCSALAGVADEFNCPIINGYKALGVNSTNNSAFSADGTHLNDHGRKVFGVYIGGCLIAPSGSEALTVEIPQGGGGLSDYELIDTLDWSTEELAQLCAGKEYSFEEIHDVLLVYTGLANDTTTVSGLNVVVNNIVLTSSAEPVSGKSGMPMNGYVFLHSMPGIGLFSLKSPGAIASNNYGTTNANIAYNLHPVTGKITKFKIYNMAMGYCTNTGILKIYVR